MKEKELITLDRDCEAVGLLGGKKLVLPAGSQVLVTRFSQDGFTVKTQDGLLMRIPTPDAPIGKAKAEALRCPSEKSSSTIAMNQLRYVAVFTGSVDHAKKQMLIPKLASETLNQGRLYQAVGEYQIFQPEQGPPFVRQVELTAVK